MILYNNPGIGAIKIDFTGTESTIVGLFVSSSSWFNPSGVATPKNKGR
jgi:hypothetical protein